MRNWQYDLNIDLLQTVEWDPIIINRERLFSWTSIWKSDMGKMKWDIHGCVSTSHFVSQKITLRKKKICSFQKFKSRNKMRNWFSTVIYEKLNILSQKYILNAWRDYMTTSDVRQVVYIPVSLPVSSIQMLKTVAIGSTRCTYLSCGQVHKSWPQNLGLAVHVLITWTVWKAISVSGCENKPDS